MPEGVDPSFLAALPEEMRQEVIDEQRRLQTIRQRAAQNVEAGVSEVDPQFLAALPTNIQEEVLAQQRIEQQRQAAQANPEAPVDPGEFLQTLPGKLPAFILNFSLFFHLNVLTKKWGKFVLISVSGPQYGHSQSE